MNRNRLVALACRISRGVVEDERAFEVTLEDGTAYVGVAPAHYLWDADGRPLAVGHPEGDREIEGLVAARLVTPVSLTGAATVTTPDGGAMRVRARDIRNRPTEVVIGEPS